MFSTYLNIHSLTDLSEKNELGQLKDDVNFVLDHEVCSVLDSSTYHEIVSQ